MKISEAYSFTKLSDDLTRLSGELQSALDDLRKSGRAWAERENDYRRAKAVAYLQQSEGTVQARSALVDKVCEAERLQAHIAEAEKEACVERVRSLRTIISAYQTLANVHMAEMNMSALPQPQWGAPSSSAHKNTYD